MERLPVDPAETRALLQQARAGDQHASSSYSRGHRKDCISSSTFTSMCEYGHGWTLQTWYKRRKWKHFADWMIV
jgi:hypothetical protein